MSLTRCAAPVWSSGGALRCVCRRPCPLHTHAWDIALLPLAIVWTIRPWWPTRLGKARTRGLAHHPGVSPCRACHLENAADCPPEDTRARHAAGTYVPGFQPGGVL